MSDGRSRNGGYRPGAGAPGKPEPTPAEWAIIDGTKSLAAKARLLSAHRLDGAKDARTIKKRSVSAHWVSERIKMRRQSNPAGGDAMPNIESSTDDSRTRITPAISPDRKETDPLTFAAQKAQADPTQTVQVDSAGSAGQVAGRAPQPRTPRQPATTPASRTAWNSPGSA